MNAQWNMSFSGEAPNTEEGQEAFEKAFNDICALVDKFSIENENHLNDNGQFYLYDEAGNATSYNVHEPIPMAPGEPLPVRKTATSKTAG